MGFDTKRVYKHFEGMNSAYEREIANYKRFMAEKDKYSPDYVRAYVSETKKAINEMVKERVQAATAEIDAIKAEMKTRTFKDPYADIKGPVIRTEDKILVELQRLNKMQVLNAKMSAVSSPDDLKALYEEHKEDGDFYNLFQSELKKRIDNKEHSGYDMLQMELDRDPEEYKELDQLTVSLRMMANETLYPAGLEQNGVSGAGFQSILPKEDKGAF